MLDIKSSYNQFDQIPVLDLLIERTVYDIWENTHLLNYHLFKDEHELWAQIEREIERRQICFVYQNAIYHFPVQEVSL